MNALTIAAAFTVAPPPSAVGGVLVFPVSPVFAWLIFGGLLAAACAVLGWLSERQTRPRRLRRIARPRRWRPIHPHPSRT